MAMLRISVGGQPVQFLDLGPARARLSTNQYGSMGGQLLPTLRGARMNPITLDLETVSGDAGSVIEEASARVRATLSVRRHREHLNSEPCAAVLKDGDLCASKKGHRDHHRRIAK